MLTAHDFERLGFWEDTTPEENITVYGMDFDSAYITLTDIDGKTPTKPEAPIVIAAYDDDSRFLWFAEMESFDALKELCLQAEAESQELLTLLEAQAEQ